jgi:hypothetical protein
MKAINMYKSECFFFSILQLIQISIKSTILSTQMTIFIHFVKFYIKYCRDYRANFQLLQGGRPRTQGGNSVKEPLTFL